GLRGALRVRPRRRVCARRRSAILLSFVETFGAVRRGRGQAARLGDVGRVPCLFGLALHRTMYGPVATPLRRDLYAFASHVLASASNGGWVEPLRPATQSPGSSRSDRDRCCAAVEYAELRPMRVRRGDVARLESPRAAAVGRESQRLLAGAFSCLRPPRLK